MAQDMVSFVATPEMLPLAHSVRQLIVDSKQYHGGNFAIREVIPIKTERFADGITLPQVLESIRRTEVFVFYSTPIGNPDLGFAELTKILNATHFASPNSIKLVLPHFWEGRADRKPKARVSTNTKELARIIDRYASKGLFTFDLHAEQIVLAFDITPVDDLKGQVLLARHFRDTLGWKPEQVGIVAADDGGVKRATKFAEASGFPYMGHVYKERSSANVASAKRYIGEPIDGLHVIMPDDLGDTGGTMETSGALLKEKNGARSVTASITHWVASPKDHASKDSALRTAEAKFRNAGMNVVALNTIPRSPSYLKRNKDFLTMIPCDQMLADAIAASLTPGESVSKLSH